MAIYIRKELLWWFTLSSELHDKTSNFPQRVGQSGTLLPNLPACLLPPEGIPSLKVQPAILLPASFSLTGVSSHWIPRWASISRQLRKQSLILLLSSGRVPRLSPVGACRKSQVAPGDLEDLCRVGVWEGPTACGGSTALLALSQSDSPQGEALREILRQFKIFFKNNFSFSLFLSLQKK